MVEFALELRVVGILREERLAVVGGWLSEAEAG